MALAAVTVNIDGLPEVIEGGLAEMLTVGDELEAPELLAKPPPHPVNRINSIPQDSSAAG